MSNPPTTHPKRFFLRLALFASLASTSLLTGCGHSAGTSPPATVTSAAPRPSGGQTAPAANNAATPTAKAAAQFFQDVASGNTAAARAEMVDGPQGDPIGQIATRVKADGAISNIECAPNVLGQGEVTGTLTFADNKKLNFDVSESSSGGIDPMTGKAKGKWMITSIIDTDTGLYAPKK